MKKYFPLFLVIFFTAITVIPFFLKGFFITQDIVFLTRIMVAANALKDGQIPIRWVDELRYGEPLFNYYAPLPYYFAGLLNTTGLDIISSAKITIIAATFLSGYFTYLLIKSVWGASEGLLASFLYLFSPYRAVDLYIRGAFSESIAFAWYPLIFYLQIKLANVFKKITFVLLSFSLSLLIITHNISAVMFLPFSFLFSFFLSLSRKNLKIFWYFLSSFVLSLFFSAFYWIPALFENNFVQTNKTVLSLDYFVNQFVKLAQFIYPSWNSSIIPHELGYIQILLILPALLLFIFKKTAKNRIYFGVFFLYFLLSIFIQTKSSLNLWLILPLIGFIQFPWRFSAITIFMLSLLGSGCLANIKDKTVRIILFTTVISLVIITQINYFQPKDYNQSYRDQDLIHLEDEYLPKDYLPSGVKEKTEVKILKPQPMNNAGVLNIYNLEQNSLSYSFRASLEKPIEVIIPVYYFPGWTASVNNQPKSISKQPKSGLIVLSLSFGNNDVKLTFKNTKIREIANILSLISLLLTGLWFVKTSLCQLKNRY